MTEGLSRTVAQWVVGTRFEDLPADVVSATGSFILDHFGVVLGGTVKASSRIITEMADRFAPAAPPCTVVGMRRRNSAPFAALVNGTAGHALELDDDHRSGTQHPGVAVIPAAFAVGEEGESTGREFVRAVALGYEVMIRIGEAHLGKSYLRGFHPTGTCGSIGAAVAAGTLMGLDVERMVGAIGLGASQSAGLLTFRSNGAWNKRFHAGHAAMSGVLAADLARREFRGPSESLDSPEGWLQAFAYEGQYDRGFVENDLGRRWALLENSIKVHACCRFAAPIVDATLATVVREDVRPDDVDEIVIKMARYPLTRSLTEPRERKLNPSSVVDAQFSAPFAAAVAVAKRRAFVDEYSEEGIRDHRVLTLARRVRWEVDPEAERLWPRRYPCEVEIRRKDGASVRSRVEWPKGDPENPVGPDELEQKFHRLADPVLGVPAVSAVLARLRDLPNLPSVRALGPLLAPENA